MIIGIELDEMPTDCYECPLQIKFKDGVQDDWYMRRCTVKNRAIEYPKPEWCPLKEQETELEQKLKEQEDAYSKLSKEYLSLANRAANKPNIVRCKDCRFGYASEFAPPEMRDIWCCARNHILSTVKPDFFCADGERKEGGEV